jgi:hypothetical protein
MTTQKRETSKRGTKKLKLKKETLKNLSVRPKVGDIKGGARPKTALGCTELCTLVVTCVGC